MYLATTHRCKGRSFSVSCNMTGPHLQQRPTALDRNNRRSRKEEKHEPKKQRAVSLFFALFECSNDTMNTGCASFASAACVPSSGEPAVTTLAPAVVKGTAAVAAGTAEPPPPVQIKSLVFADKEEEQEEDEGSMRHCRRAGCLCPWTTRTREETRQGGCSTTRWSVSG